MVGPIDRLHLNSLLFLCQFQIHPSFQYAQPAIMSVKLHLPHVQHRVLTISIHKIHGFLVKTAVIYGQNSMANVSNTCVFVYILTKIIETVENNNNILKCFVANLTLIALQ